MHHKQVYDGNYKELYAELDNGNKFLETQPTQYAVVIVGKSYDDQLAYRKDNGLVLIYRELVRIAEPEVSPVTQRETELETHHVYEHEVEMLHPISCMSLAHPHSFHDANAVCDILAQMRTATIRWHTARHHSTYLVGCKGNPWGCVEKFN